MNCFVTQLFFFQAIRRGLEDKQVVEEIVVDFEKALWKAIRRSFPTTFTKGCSFHWGQAVWRQVQVIVFVVHIFLISVCNGRYALAKLIMFTVSGFIYVTQQNINRHLIDVN